MSKPPRLLAFAGSLRSGSFNRLLIQALVVAGREAGAEVDLIDLRDYSLPLYDGDIEALAMPDTVRALQGMFAHGDGFLIATPEYNGASPALIKNTLDWISRPLADGKSGTTLFRGKIAGICSASPGPMGGLRALITLRDALAKFGLWVAPTQVAIGRADTAFDANGVLVDAGLRISINAIAAEVTNAVSAR